MQRDDERDRENQALRDRLSRLSQASLRINESLDFDNVLQEVVDSARALTDSRYGALTVHGGDDELPDFIVSGMGPQEHQGLWDMPQGQRFFEYLSGLETPLRVPDVQSYLGALGMPDFRPAVPVTSLLVAPIRHGGAGVGTIYLSKGEEGGEFTQEDEDVVVMFASQAALVIANARKHREELRARRDMETLVDTSPVAVLVFDARTGELASFNREARRIAGELVPTAATIEEVLSVVRVRRTDGSEMQIAEIPLQREMSAGERIRVEEIVIEAPDEPQSDGPVERDAHPRRGRKRRDLCHHPTGHDAPGGDGASEGGVPGHGEPRAAHPADLRQGLRHESAGPLRLPGPRRGSPVPPDNRRAVRPDAGPDKRPSGRGPYPDRQPVGLLQPGGLAGLVDEAKSTYLSGGGRNNIRIEIPPGLPAVMADGRRIVQVIGNLLSNASRHSPESSVIRVAAELDGLYVSVSVIDAGRGIPADRLPHLFRKFSRFDVEDQGGDTGLGLAICKGIVEAHGGRIWAESDGLGLGARFTFTLPANGEAATAVAEETSRSGAGSRRVASEPPRVLAVDDDPQTLRYVRDVLSKAGYAVTVTADPDEVPRLIEEELPDLVLLDLMLPGADGIELMETVRETAEVPVIFLSAYGQDQVIARAFQRGAADYIVKPFSPTELAARIQAAMRRQAAPVVQTPSVPYVLGDLVIDYARYSVTVAGAPVELTPLEYRLLVELSANAGRLMTHAQLLQRVWGQDNSGGSGPVRTYVKRLRSKLGDDPDNPAYIFTKRRFGYWMEKA